MRTCNRIKDWITAVKRGKVHSSSEVKKLMTLLDKVIKDPNVECRSGDVEDCIDFAEEYFFPLYLEQKAVIGAIVGLYYKDTGFLVFNQIFWMMGRGGGKNGFISVIVAWMLSKQGIKNYHVDIVATAEDQAKTSFEEIYEMIDNLSDGKRRQWHYNLVQIMHKGTRSKLRYRTSNAKTKDGGRPGCVVFDEIHAFEHYDDIKVFTGGLGKVERPRRIYITTEGEVRDGLLDDFKERSQRILDGEEEHKGFLPIIMKLDTIQEIGKKELWDKANPRINYSPVLRHQIETEYDEMLSNERLKEAFITKRMNIPYQGKDILVATREDILAAMAEPMQYTPGTICQGSFDFADIRDFASAGIRWKENGKTYFFQHTWIHEAALELTKFNIDLEECVRLGLATIVKKSEYPTIHPGIIAEWFLEQRKTYNIKAKIKCDHFRASLIKDEFEKRGLMIDPIRSGYITHNKIAPLLQGLFSENKIVMPDDRLMRWYLHNVKVETDRKGNRTFMKIEPIKRKTDGFFCLLHSLVDDELKEQNNNLVFYDVRSY